MKTKKLSPQTNRKMYFDVKKELDVARIESLIKQVSPARITTETSARASNASKLQSVNQTEMRKMLDSMKKQGSKLDSKDTSL